MNILKIENTYSWLQTDNQVLKDKLWKLLRFRNKNYFHNAAYRMKVWDGFDEFFNKSTGRFLTGLLPEVLFAINKFEVEIQFDDKRNKFQFNVEKIDDNFLPPKKLRDYQVDYINEVIINRRAIIPAPPGAGKSIIACGIIKTLPKKTMTLFLCNRVQLVEQFYEELVSMGINDIGRFHGTKKELDKSIIISTVQSADQLEKLLPKIEVLIVDEIHEMTTKTAKKVYKKLVNASVRVGLSGTAFKDGDPSQKYDVKGWIGPVVNIDCTESGKLTTKELQDRDILSQAECSFFVIDKPFLPYAVYMDAVKYGIAENQYLHEKIVELVGKVDGRILILVDRIAHGDMLYEMMPNSLWVKGEDTIETRKEVIQKLKYSKDKVVAIATSKIFGVGLSFEAHVLISVGGKSSHGVIQKFGRGLRKNDTDKFFLQYFDFMFTNNQYLEDHSKKRIKILKKEGHKVKVYQTIEDWENKD